MSTIQLIPEQQRALDADGLVRAVDPRTNAAYILVPEEEYQRLSAVPTNGSVYTTAEMLDRVMADDDANDPLLEAYQRKYSP
jgi:hypothetical protein